MDGAERIKWDADREVRRNSKKFVDKLTAKALKGDLSSIKLLVMLAERKKPRPLPVKRSRGVGIALEWAAEAEWKGPPEGEEDVAVMGAGNRG